MYDIESNLFIENEPENIINNNFDISRPFYKMKKSISYPSKINNYEIELISFNNPIIYHNKNINNHTNQQNQTNFNNFKNINNPVNLNEQNNSDNLDNLDNLDNSIVQTELLIEKSNYEKFQIQIIKIINFTGLNKINKIELLNKLLSVFLHIFIMVTFEIYFYFNYVVHIERNEFLKKINSYLNQIESNANFNQIQKQIIKNIIESQNYGIEFINYLYEQYMESLQEQKKILHQLLILACKMGGIIGIILLILFGFGLANRKKIKWKWILFENILMFILLGIFEYLFFTYIVLHYNPITDAEIKYFVADNLYNYFNSTM